MPMRVRIAGEVMTLSTGRVRIAGEIMNLKAGRVRIEDGVYPFYTSDGGGGGTFTVSATPASIFGARASSSSVVVTCEAVTATPSFGTPPYTYAWTNEGADGGSWSGSNLGTPSPTIRCGVNAYETWNATWRCTVTDSTSATAFVDVSAQASNFGDLRGF